MSEFQLQKTNIKQTRIVENDLSSEALADGKVRLKIDKFALTANNVTYAVVGEQIGYWQFFPPHTSDAQGNEVNTEGWGVLPVWGFADVEASNCNEVSVGMRFFGYFPPADHLIVEPTKVGPSSFVDASQHRAKLPTAYNVYRKVEPGTNSASEDDRMLLFPLHITSFALYDYFQENNWFGAEQVVMISASSKTSTGLAYGIDSLIQDGDIKLSRVALTSTKNKDMVTSLDVYDLVLSYDAISEIDNAKPTLIVDMSGNGAVLSQLHAHLGDNMKFCSNVGVTHRDEMDSQAKIIKERSEFFFAPSQIQKRLQEWGPKGFEQKSGEYLQMSISRSKTWLKMTELNGLEGMQAIFDDVCDGKIAPEAGLIVKLS